MKVMDLNGKWKVCDASSQECTYEATVPGDIHDDLMKAGVIVEPYYGDNSKKCSWVVEKDWKYTKTFNVDDLNEKTYIVFDGIDTVSTIYLNGVKIAETDNMFMQYRIDVTDTISIGENKLEVIIHSIRKELDKYPKEGYYGCFNKQRIFIRKAQCHFSWDWAPDFPATGIWKDVYLETRKDTYINDINIRTELDGHVTFFVNMPETCNDKQEREIEITVGDDVYRYKTMDQKNFYTIKIDNPKLWWPRVLGEPNLYEYKIKMFADGELCDEKSGKFGIRTVRMEEKPTKNMDGFTCQIYVNEKPVFFKGANWVPLDVMTGCITKERYEKAIKLAYDANFTLLRVWGGGIYESEDFYNICDELGMMVWQDFAYACADVPDNNFDFINRAIAEAEQQVYRLRNHPSLVLYCGGNEKTGSHGKNKQYGDKIIYYYIRGVVDHLDGTRPYFPSSPWGYGDIGNTQSSGDCHCNSYQKAMISPYNHDALGIENFRDVLKTFDAAMASEIAVQGAPTLASLKKYIPEDKLWPLNEMYDLHFMRNPYDGTNKWFPEIQLEVAEQTFGKIDGLEDFCKKSSTFHSELLRADCEYHKANIGRCSGTMNWMFNDIWPCGTWSVVDYYMTPMPAYYALRRSYVTNNLIITKTMEGYQLFVVNETDRDMDYSVEFGMADMYGNNIGDVKKAAGVVKPYSSRVLYTYDECGGTDCFMFAKGEVDGDARDASLFCTLWKDVNFVEPELDTKIEKTADGVMVTVNTKNYARCVNVTIPEKDDVEYSDNYFDILPGCTKTVFVKGNDIKAEDVVVRNWMDKWEY